MFGRKSRLIAEERARVVQLQEQLAAAKGDASAHLGAAVRTAQRNTRLLEQLDEGHPAEDAAAEAAYTQTLEKRLDRALRAAGRYLAAVWQTDADADTVLRELLDVKAQLRRSTEMCRALEERLREAQAANDALSREAADRAGTLTKPKAVGTP